MNDQKLNFQNISNYNSSEDLDIGKLFRLLLMQSKLIILMVFLGSALGIGVYLTTDKVYKVSSLLQVFNNTANNFNSDVVMDLYMGSSNTSDLDDVEDLYKSRTNILKVIDSNKLNFKSNNIGFNGVKNILFFEDNIELGKKGTYLFSFKDNGYEISNKDISEKKLLAYGVPASFQTLNLEISRPESLPTETVEITYNHPEDMFLKIKRKFQVVSSIPKRSFSAARNKGLLEISYLAADPEHGIEVLNFANNLFIQGSIDIESEQARKAIEFIDDRISRVEKELELDKTNLLKFKDTNRSIDVDIEVQTILETVSDIENKIYELDIEIAKASNLYTDSNPFFQDLLYQRDALAAQRSAVESEIKELPLAQQQYIDLFRNLETTREVYTELVNRRLEFSIKEASTLGNIRIVDDAYFNEIVSPQISIVFISFIFSAVFAIIFAIVRGLFFIPISNPAELADNRINNPIIGVVPKIEDSEDINDRFDQSMESFIVNLNTLSLSENGCTTALLTSPTPENGKSFISRSLAKKLSKVEGKVLIMDCDFKRGDQHKALEKSKIKLKEFKELDELSIEQLKIDKNLYFLPKITGLSNSFEFLYSDSFNQKMAFFKDYFDFIVIDTPPLLSVSDTGILMTYSDINIGVVRHGLNKINEIKQLLSISEQIGSSFDGFLYNAYERPSSYYGYYGFYGNYAYQYYAKKYLYQAYDYKKDV